MTWHMICILMQVGVKVITYSASVMLSHLCARGVWGWMLRVLTFNTIFVLDCKCSTQSRRSIFIDDCLPGVHVDNKLECINNTEACGCLCACPASLLWSVSCCNIQCCCCEFKRQLFRPCTQCSLDKVVGKASEALSVRWRWTHWRQQSLKSCTKQDSA